MFEMGRYISRWGVACQVSGDAAPRDLHSDKDMVHWTADRISERRWEATHRNQWTRSSNRVAIVLLGVIVSYCSEQWQVTWVLSVRTEELDSLESWEEPGNKFCSFKLHLNLIACHVRIVKESHDFIILIYHYQISLPLYVIPWPTLNMYFI